MSAKRSVAVEENLDEILVEEELPFKKLKVTLELEESTVCTGTSHC